MVWAPPQLPTSSVPPVPQPPRGRFQMYEAATPRTVEAAISLVENKTKVCAQPPPPLKASVARTFQLHPTVVTFLRHQRASHDCTRSCLKE